MKLSQREERYFNLMKRPNGVKANLKINKTRGYDLKRRIARKGYSVETVKTSKGIYYKSGETSKVPVKEIVNRSRGVKLMKEKHTYNIDAETLLIAISTVQVVMLLILIIMGLVK